ncbi:MAG TPA: hypothetical protein VEL31_13835, partial [Ktedonobacteraceae bacterium]|nr:hypothetical protein [Ktedonobacteraceae bacterium]
MQRAEISGAEPQEGERRCLQCQKTKPLLAFSRRKGKADERKMICSECEQFNQHERHRRLATQRKAGQQQQEWEERKQHEWERRMALRQAHEQRLREKEYWYLQQPDRRCRMCHQILPASAFGGMSSSDGFILHTRCTTCHEALRERRQLACCLCREKTPRRDFLSSYDGYALCGDGAWISLCCQGCESAFRALPAVRQGMHIRACCQRSFPPGQVIYAEVDPEKGDIRYVGRTGKPQRRHAQHLGDTSPTAVQWGAERKAWYTRSNWMHALSEKGLTPSMQILQNVEVSSLVVEWEQRFIWHGMQRGWKLLNGETMDEKLVARVKAACFDFLQVPFELLVQQHFFSSHGLAAFLHKWHQSEVLAG